MRTTLVCILTAFLAGCVTTSSPPAISTVSEEDQKAASFAFFRCMEKAARKLDDGLSDAATIAMAIRPICSSEFEISYNYGGSDLSPYGKMVYHKKETEAYMKIATMIVLNVRSKKNQ